MKKIVRHRVGEIPLMEAIVKRLNLRSILEEFLPRKNNEEIAPSDVLILLIYNLAIEKAPLYELEDWLSSLDLRCIGLENANKNIRLTDDRFGKILDKLFDVDRATLMTRIVIEAVQQFNIDLQQLHNDSTSVKAFGDYPGKTATGLELKKGNSKDHRPDLKQLVYTLTISRDGAVPIHFKTYPGNTNDDSTHIETWKILCNITQSANFLYVADCKLCSDRQLSHISENGGKALVPIPEYWSEVIAFKESLRQKNKPKKEIWRKVRQNCSKIDYFSVYKGEYFTTKRGYRIHWIHYSERQKDDFNTRQENLEKAENALNELVPKLNKRKFKTEEIIKDECNKILKKYKVERFINVTINHTIEQKKICNNKRGRPSNEKEYQMIENKLFSLSWIKNKKALTAEKNVDGVYPLLSTDRNLSAKEAIMAFKYQPKLEKRFMQLKSIHNIAPLFCKKLERVEANMFVFFVALLIQALIEREIRYKMANAQIPSLQIYPENRYALHPTTSKVFDFFSRVYTYDIIEHDKVVDKYTDELSGVQKAILNLLSIGESEYWRGILAKAG